MIWRVIHWLFPVDRVWYSRCTPDVIDRVYEERKARLVKFIKAPIRVPDQFIQDGVYVRDECDWCSGPMMVAGEITIESM
jgi:hypothetical protein